METMKPIRPRIGTGARKTISTGQPELVTFEPLIEQGTLPLACRPAVAGVSLADWGGQHREQIESHLCRHGAILFRGFGVADVAEFNACIDAISGGALQYLFRASPRTQIDKSFNIYTSTDYPADEKIFPHNEHSYSPVFPLRLYFFCDTPAATGGETPLGDTRALLRRIDPEVRDQFARKKIMYVRNYGDGMGLPWQTVFQTQDRQEAEAYCRGVGIQVEWKSGDRLRTRQIGPAIVRHPRTGEAVWFNHGTFFHWLSLPEKVRDGLRAEFSEEDLPQNTFYGDGAPIENEVILHLQDAYRRSMVEFPWEKGDVLLLDNMLALHARNEFTGYRRILTAMAEAFRSAELEID